MGARLIDFGLAKLMRDDDSPAVSRALSRDRPAQSATHRFSIRYAGTAVARCDLRMRAIGGYRLVSKLGEGGMGVVWLAEHILLGRRAALKLLNARLSHNDEIVQRFFNEARAASSIADPGIVQIFDFGRDAERGAYIVMELLDGEPLDRRLQRERRLAVEDAVRIVRQVATSLEAAHARGIVHRDLKPENIFLVRDPEVIGGERAKILDFGIAKLVGDDGSGVATKASAVMGTPMYMSPEQCRGAGEVDHRSDIYSLGCVLFLLITGRTPFIAEGSGELLVMHMVEAAPPPSRFAAHVPAALDAIVLRCLAKDRSERFATAAALAVALSDTFAVATPSPAPLRVVTSPAAVTTLSSSTGALPAAEPRSSRKAIALVGGACLAITAGVIARSTRGDEIAPSSAPTAVAPVAPDAALVVADAVSPDTAPAPAATTVARMSELATSLRVWAIANPGAGCPSALATDRLDGWGHVFVVTCTRQPADQQFGIVSHGADGIADTPDDIESWQVPDVHDALLGSRWRTRVPTTPALPRVEPAHQPARPAPSTFKDENADGIPDCRSC